jgi:hypothetical protein
VGSFLIKYLVGCLSTKISFFILTTTKTIFFASGSKAIFPSGSKNSLDLCAYKNCDFLKRVYESYGKRTSFQAVPYVTRLEKSNKKYIKNLKFESDRPKSEHVGLKSDARPAAFVVVPPASTWATVIMPR